jgi:aldose 1-epimerase
LGGSDVCDRGGVIEYVAPIRYFVPQSLPDDRRWTSHAATQLRIARTLHENFIGAVGLAALATALAGGAHAASLSVNVAPFGKLPDGEAVQMYHLQNANGVEVNIITYGGAVQSIMMPDKNGHGEDVALGYGDLEGYLHDQASANTYFGALIGRYANRIADGKFTLDGKTYNIPINNPPNALHGGPEGFNTKVWAASKIELPGTVGVELTMPIRLTHTPASASGC